MQNFDAIICAELFSHGAYHIFKISNPSNPTKILLFPTSSSWKKCPIMIIGIVLSEVNGKWFSVVKRWGKNMKKAVKIGTCFV